MKKYRSSKNIKKLQNQGRFQILSDEDASLVKGGVKQPKKSSGGGGLGQISILIVLYSFFQPSEAH